MVFSRAARPFTCAANTFAGSQGKGTTLPFFGGLPRYARCFAKLPNSHFIFIL
jgi:hypothetical protein